MHVRICKGRSKGKRKAMASVDNYNNNNPTSHDGIKSVKMNNPCELSNNSDICICVVTWNMNGQVINYNLLWFFISFC